MLMRMAELMAALSLATDLGTGQPLEFAMQSCVLAVRLGTKLNFTAEQLRDTYYQALLRYIGCNANTHLLAAVAGDELVLRHDLLHLDSTSPDFLGLVLRLARECRKGMPVLEMLREVTTSVVDLARASHELLSGHCEVAGRLGQRLGFPDSLVRALGQVYARWDGRGLPGLRHEEVSPSMLAVALAQDMNYYLSLEGLPTAAAVARKRAGGAYCPAHAECFIEHADELCDGLAAELSWDMILALEPEPHRLLEPAELDGACEALADYADLKSPYFLGHSRGVAERAAAAARHSGLPAADAELLRRTGLLHDLGRVGVSAAIWSKPGPLTESEWEKVRLHPYYTERVLSRAPSLARLGELASFNHERMDGSGYHRALAANAIPPLARLLAAADVYQALREERPWRPARSADAAADALRAEVRLGRLDGQAVDCVLAGAGHRVRKAREYAAGLSEREVEVLRLLARGLSTRQVAEELTVAPKTVDNHIQRLYAKTGVTTRAGATLYALEHGLLS